MNSTSLDLDQDAGAGKSLTAWRPGPTVNVEWPRDFQVAVGDEVVQRHVGPARPGR